MPEISLFLGVRYNKVGTFSICLCHFYEGTYWHWLIGLIRDEKPLTWKCIKVWRCNTPQLEVLRLLLCENYYPYLFVVKVYQLIRLGLVGEELYRPQLKTDLWNQSKNEACGHHTLIIFSANICLICFSPSFFMLNPLIMYWFEWREKKENDIPTGLQYVTKYFPQTLRKVLRFSV